MCSNVRPDFNAEEVASVEKDQKELDIIVDDMADHLPIEDPNKGNPYIQVGFIKRFRNCTTYYLSVSV